MSLQPGRELSEVLNKIPFFKNLTSEHISKILGLSSPGFYQPGDKIWVGDGRPSNEMYILLSGELAVLNGQGRKVATIKPVTTSIRSVRKEIRVFIPSIPVISC